MYVELPDVGTTVTKGKNFGAVESVKATSDVYSPVSGEVVEVNSELNNSPGLVSPFAYCCGFFYFSVYSMLASSFICNTVYI